jgi:hypothetical protein
VPINNKETLHKVAEYIDRKIPSVTQNRKLCYSPKEMEDVKKMSDLYPSDARLESIAASIDLPKVS